MVERGVSQLPVVSEGRLVGAVTREALLSVVRARLLVGDETETKSRTSR